VDLSEPAPQWRTSSRAGEEVVKRTLIDLKAQIAILPLIYRFIDLHQGKCKKS